MLKAIELAGFKSFADKTRFDFPDGITVIVGPNGSGKSNVVDAIKWVLGAQSAKSLRGKDMIDVIFKGSAAAGRKPANAAEATLIFDNSKKNLPIDAPEVYVTRRVFRSGEGEYLINKQPCRLKDIKDLFRGTGVGVDAYSLIEQGKVDRMLQASPADRRMIFEEAAGLSRFKIKKTEALRRLLRVDQNLVRLKDIVDEVHGRLTALKNQASKAQAYREMTERLHGLRLRLGWTEYSELGDRIEAQSTTSYQLRKDQAAKQVELEVARDSAQQADMALHRVAEQCQSVETTLRGIQQRIAVDQNQQATLRERVTETETEKARCFARLAALHRRMDSLQLELEVAAEKTATAQLETDRAQARTQEAELVYSELKSEAQASSQRCDWLRKQQFELLRIVSDQATALSQQQNRLADVAGAISTTQQSIEKTALTEQQVRRQAEQAAAQLKQIHQASKDATEQLQTAQLQLEENRRLLTGRQADAAVLHGRLEGARERLSVLEQMQQQFEGVDAGVRKVLSLAASGTEPAWQTIRGLIADLLECEIHVAPLIDTALGPLSQAVVLRDGQLIDLVRDGALQIDGRLSLMRLDTLPSRRFGEKIQLDGVRGVIGRADRLIQCPEDLVPLFRHLLGTTWLVDSLPTALELGHFRGAGLRFVTAHCHLVDGDGTLTIGAQHAASGLISRRSEMQAVRVEVEHYSFQVREAQSEIGRLEHRIGQLTPNVRKLEAEVLDLGKQLAHQQVRAQHAVSRLDELEQQSQILANDLSNLAAEHSSLEPKLVDALLLLESNKEQVRAVESELLALELQVAQRQGALSRSGDELTASRIELARSEQRLESLRTTLEQFSRNQQERQQALVEADQEFERLDSKRKNLELEILSLTSQLADASLDCEAEESNLQQLAIQAAELRNTRVTLHKQHESIHRAVEKFVQRLQAIEQELERNQQTRAGLLRRLGEDYQIELDLLQTAELITTAEARAEIESEAAQLRQDVAGVGAVNLTALAELDELQSRYDHLHGQYEDVNAAKESLQRIIHKINADSRRLFLDTLETIRQNFQQLYRKAFGGGSADIILEEGEDVLECGVDIIATPPGKTALSNSLLSGGEKALTAVALLLAIFQFRPSPFCVLDEVDAPFDEANIGRFVNVLTEFLDWTKFVVVTHSKKTMTAADTLYGVTMQESGVSKQVAVRFEDVGDDGAIRPTENRESTPHRKAA